MGRKNRKKVAIISRESDEKSLDIRLLEEELASRGVELVTMCKLLEKGSFLKSLGYVGETARQAKTIAGSDVVILDTYCIPASMLPHGKGTKIIQIWHALGAVKKFGWQTVGMPDGTSEKVAKVMRMHKGYDYVISASDATAEHFAEAFGVPRSKIVKLGLPRIDYIRRVTTSPVKEETRERIYDKYPALRKAKEEGRKVVLYAPTFRRGDAPDVSGLAKALDPKEYFLIVKLHPLYRGDEAVLRSDNVIYDDAFETYDLLAAADAVVSDYSSLVLEATLADLPLYLYVYDIDEYGATTGLNIDFKNEAIGKYAFTDASELANALGEAYDMEALRRFRDKYIEVDYDERSCTAQLADFVESLIEK